MDGKDGKLLVWTIGAQMLALALSLLVIYLIVWASSKAWKKGQTEASYTGDNWRKKAVKMVGL